LKSALIVEPLVCKKFAAVHASDRNNHSAYYRLRFGSRQICCHLSFYPNKRR
jgi:hypothetical protein